MKKVSKKEALIVDQRILWVLSLNELPSLLNSSHNINGRTILSFTRRYDRLNDLDVPRHQDFIVYALDQV